MRFFFVSADTFNYKIHTLNNVCVTPIEHAVDQNVKFNLIFVHHKASHNFLIS